MKRVLALLILAPILALVGCSGEQQAGGGDGLAMTATGEVPPLVDRELFFGDPEISNSDLSRVNPILS